jgi:hypothetical protein
MQTLRSITSSPPTLAKSDFDASTTTSLQAGRAGAVARAGWAGAAGVALLAVGALAARAGSRRGAWASAAVGAGLLLTRWQLARWFTWQPPYVLEQRIGRLEVRRYREQTWAETSVRQANWSDTLDEGFRRLARFIFGDNARSERLEMTAPVLVTLPGMEGQPRYARANPYVERLETLTGIGTRTVAFILGQRIPLKELPAPIDPRVQLRTVPERLYAVLRFRGRYSGDLPADKRNELLFLARCAGLRTTGDVVFAGYDGPSTLPLLRRSEVLVSIAE